MSRLVPTSTPHVGSSIRIRSASDASAREQHLLLIAARERQDARVHRRAANADLGVPRFDHVARRREIDESALAFRTAEQPAQVQNLRDGLDQEHAVASPIARDESETLARPCPRAVAAS